MYGFYDYIIKKKLTNVINSQKEASATGLRVSKLFIAVAALARFSLFGERSK